MSEAFSARFVGGKDGGSRRQARSNNHPVLRTPHPAKHSEAQAKRQRVKQKAGGGRGEGHGLDTWGTVINPHYKDLVEG